jgi:hypothetical protein
MWQQTSHPVNPDLKSLLINLLAMALGGTLVWLYKQWKERRLRRRRLIQLEQVSRDNEVAICIRVGGASEALKDVQAYLKTRPRLTTLLLYDIGPTEANLADPKIAGGVVEDIVEGVRAYGKGPLTRVHFFPSGMLAYAPILTDIIANWGNVVVYHRTGDGYLPLYEVSKDKIHELRREFPAIKNWQVVSLNQATSPTPPTK